MLKALKQFLDEAFGDGGTPAPDLARRNLALAVAALLHEVARVDLDESTVEHAAAKRALRELCQADDSEAEQLLAEGRSNAERLTSYFKPLSLIKREFSLSQRILFVEHLWRVAYADGPLDPYEDHLVRKIATLLYVSNTQTMLARSRAQERA